MTKRVLSMLMALIMALSLCVPAFAADEPVSADEPAAEVEAPAAEAEETAEEPEAEEVEAEAEPVDEPAEVAVDEPETAAVDEPLLVALGIVNKDAHYALKKAVEDAAAIEAKIQAGGVRLDGGKMDQAAFALPADLAKYAEDPVENDPFKDELVAKGTNKTFEEVYAEAKDMLEAIDGKPVDYPVTSTSVEAKATELGTWSATNVTDKVDSTNMTTTGLQHFLWNTDKSDSPAVLTYKSESVTITAITLTGAGYDLSDDPFWAQAYSADYLAKLQAAIDAVNAYVTKGTKVTYSDYKAVVYAILDALVLEQAAGKPGEAEKTSAEAALAKAEAILKDKDKEAKYLFADTIDAKKIALEGLMEKSDGFIPFKYNKTRYEVVAAIKALEDAMVETPANPTVKIKEITGTIGGATAKVTLTATKFNEVAGPSMKLDGHTYSITWKITDKDGKSKWIDGKTTGNPKVGTTGADPADTGVLGLTYATGTDSTVQALWTAGTKENAGLWVAKDVEIYNTGDGAGENDKFAEGDTLTVYIYEVKGDNKLYKLVDSKSFTFEKGEEADPEKPDATIESVTYEIKTPGSTFTDFAKDTNKLIGSVSRYDPSTYWSTKAAGTKITVKLEEAIDVQADQFDFRAVAKVGGKTFPGIVKSTANPDEFIIEVDNDGLDELLKAGENGTIELQCSEHKTSPEDRAYDVIDTAKLTVKSITEWSHAKALGDVVAAANALIDTDYDLTEIAKNQHLGEATVALTLAHIKAIAGELNALITNASLADSATNENNAVAKLQELCKWCGYLTPLAASTTEFKALWQDAKGIVDGDFTDIPEGTGTYTFDSLGKLSDLVPGKYTTNGWADGKLLSEVEAAIAEIQAAIDGLVELGEVDKTDLENSIKAAQEKLADKDQYTEESVKALENALATAESVLAMENPTQAALTNAAENLNKAVAGLVKKVDADDLAAAIEAAEAAIADPSKYTEESVKAVQDAITAAKALGDDATTEEIADAIDKLDAAVKALTEPEEPEIPAAPTGGTGWVQAEDGTYYYYEDGELVVNKWVKSKNLWYHMGADGTMDTGFIHIVDDWGDGWYYLEESNDKGTQGRMRTGWQDIDDASAGPYGWFETRSNGHQGQCTYTKGWGDFDGYIKK